MIVMRRALVRSFLRQHAAAFSCAFVSAIGVTVVNVLIPLSIGQFFSNQFAMSGGKALLLERIGLHLNTQQAFFLFFGLLMALRLALGLVHKYATGSLSIAFIDGLRRKLFAQQVRQSYTDFRQKDLAQHLNRYLNEMTPLRNYITKWRIDGVADLLFVLAVSLLVATVSVTLLVFLWTGLLAGILVAWLIGQYASRLENRRRLLRNALLKFLSERFHAFSTLKAFNRETPEISRFEKQAEKMREAEMRVAVSDGLLDTIIPVLFFGMIAGVLLWSFANPDRLGASELLASVLLLLYLQRVFRRLLRLPRTRRQGIESLDRLVAVLNNPVETRGQTTFRSPEGKLVFNRVESAYHAEPGMTALSHTFYNGSVTRLVTAKPERASALFQLVLAMQAPRSGEILIDGTSYRELSPFAVRRNVTICSDAYPLLGDNVLAAVSYSGKAEDRAPVAALTRDLLGPASAWSNPDQPIDPNHPDFTQETLRLLQLARAFFTGKKVVLLHNPFVDLSSDAIHRVVQFIHNHRNKWNLIIYSDHWPASLEADDQVSLDSDSQA